MASGIYTHRLTGLQAQLTDKQALLLTDPHDLAYFSGFQTLVPEEREGYVVVTKKDAWLLYSSFSPLPVPLETKALVGTFPRQVVQHLQFIAGQAQVTELLVDKTRMFVPEYEAIVADCPLKISALDKMWTWQLRAVKDATEIAAIQEACEVASTAYERLLPQIKVGMTEIAVQLLLENELRALGSQQTAFPTIVAFGPHTALPHHQPSDTKITDNMAVLIDFGARINGYRSDMTRSFWFGKNPAKEYTQISNIVEQAYLAVLSSFAQNPAAATGESLDTAARDVITEAGYGPKYIHTTGHGVGLDIHEPPSISAQSKKNLLPNMVITVEPGIYLPDRFGYRYENTVLVTESALDELTHPLE